MAGFKAFKDRITLLLGGNVAGYKLKHFLIWHNKNTKVFKHVNKHTLPVHYRSNKKSWIAQLLFQDALLHCYDSKMEMYYLVNYISSKFCLFVIMLPDILLLLGIFIPISEQCFSIHTPTL
jgi:hypothetical protein